MARKTVGYVRLEWTCPRCGAKNPGPQQTCISCGGPQPEDVEFQQSQGQQLLDEEAAAQAAQAAPDIHCGFCGTRNPADAVVCKQCGGDLKEGAKREAGQVLGAFSAESVADMACPNCGQPNPVTALKCASCGASLAAAPAPKPAAVPAAPKKLSPVMILLGILGLGVLVVICIALIGLFTKTSDVVATVQNASWTTSIPIEAFQPVNRADWKEKIPAGAQVGSCDYRYSYTSDQPEPVSTEVCGTPYTVDQGTGFGEVVQDCTYRVYEEYCNYSISEWTVVDTLTLQGNDLSPRLPQPSLANNQRLGQASETYTIVFSTGDGSLTYQTSDLDVFRQAQVGSRWNLTLNALGGIRSVEPAP